MKRKQKQWYLMLVLLLPSCTLQSQMTSQLSGEWVIESYELLQANGVESRQSNVGTIFFERNGQGSQSFSSNIEQANAGKPGEFHWQAGTRTVFIKGNDSDTRKAWFITNSTRSTQHWRTTDDKGNVEVMILRKKPKERPARN